MINSIIWIVMISISYIILFINSFLAYFVLFVMRNRKKEHLMILNWLVPPIILSIVTLCQFIFLMKVVASIIIICNTYIIWVMPSDKMDVWLYIVYILLLLPIILSILIFFIS